MNLDLQTTLIAIGAALAIIILLTIMLGGFRRRQSLRRDAPEEIGQEGGGPYAATKERPYVKEVAAPPAEPVAREATPPLPPQPTSQAGTPARDDGLDVAPAPVPLAGDFGGIAFPPHSTDHPDQLTRLKGVGPKLESMLNEEGITRYEQLASLDGDELAALEERLGNFKGRLTRDRVVEQARLLASGDTEGFEATFGKLGG